MRKFFLIIIALAILIKISLYLYSVVYSPQSKFMNDSTTYINTGRTLVLAGTFAIRQTDGTLSHEFLRTPGYPLFLGILNQLLKIPFSLVVLIQVFLTILVAFITYKTAIEINPRIGSLSSIIILFSPIVTIYSLLILTESLFLLFMSLFMFSFVKYLKAGKIKFLIMAALMFVIAIYVRPGAYLLGMGVAIFVIYANVTHNIKRSIFHAIIILALIYGLLGLWQLRNYAIFKNTAFSRILFNDPANVGLFHSYSRNKDPITQGMPPFLYYINVTLRCALSLFTRPGSFKYLNCYILTVVGKVLGYIWMAFRMAGFVYGITKIGRNIQYQFLLFIIVCLATGTIVAEMWFSGERYEIPLEPFIAIISAYGWIRLYALKTGRKEMRNQQGKESL